VVLRALHHPPVVGAAADAARRDDPGLVRVAAEELEGFVAHFLVIRLRCALRRLRHKPSPGALVRGHVGVPLAQHAAERELSLGHLLIRRKPEKPRGLGRVGWQAFNQVVCYPKKILRSRVALDGRLAKVARCLSEILRNAVITRAEEEA